ncbi:MAG: hypothetical protein ACTSXA_02220 [Candidatus Heimdallarchaeota archaeon]
MFFGSLVKGIVWEKSDIDFVLITKDQITLARVFLAQGTPEEVIKIDCSYTGNYLRALL